MDPGDSTEYSVSGITAYEKGMKYGDTFYAGENEEIALTLGYSSAVPAGKAVRYQASTGTLEQNGESYTLTMPADSVEITANLISVTNTLGDVNGDGQVDAKDLTALARHVARIETITEPALLKNADVTGDGDVTAADLTKLARYVARIISEL